MFQPQTAFSCPFIEVQLIRIIKAVHILEVVEIVGFRYIRQIVMAGAIQVILMEVTVIASEDGFRARFHAQPLAERSGIIDLNGIVRDVLVVVLMKIREQHGIIIYPVEKGIGDHLLIRPGGKLVGNGQ